MRYRKHQLYEDTEKQILSSHGKCDYFHAILIILVLIQVQFQSHCHSSGWGGGGRLFEFDWKEEGVRVGAYSRLGAY